MFDTFFHVSVCFRTPQGSLTEWTTPEFAVCESIADVIAAIGETEVEDAQLIRVVQIDLHECRSSEITEDALRAFGDHMLHATDEWPLWLAEFAPDEIKDELNRRAARDEAASYGVSQYLEAAE